MIKDINRINIYCLFICFLTIYLFYLLYKPNSSALHCKNSLFKKSGFNNLFGSALPNIIPMYLFACVDYYGGINEYIMPDGGEAWQKAVLHATGLGENPGKGFKRFSNNASWSDYSSNGHLGIEFSSGSPIFDDMSNNKFKDKSNSYGGGTNSTESVINLKASQIQTDGFSNNCTKEDYYLYMAHDNERDYIYAVFRRNPVNDQYKCCADASILQRNTCDKPYNIFSNDACSNVMQGYCSTGDRVFNDPLCQKWCSNPSNSAYCSTYKNNFCNVGTNIKHNLNICSSWCKTNPGGYGNCDTGINDYCNANVDDSDLCGCFDANAVKAAPTDLQKSGVITQNRAFCWNPKCVTAGYLTNSMIQNKSTCPSCLQVMNLNSITANTIDIRDLAQSCENKVTQIDTTPKPQIEPETEKETTNETKNEPEEITWMQYIINQFFILFPYL